MERKFKDFDRRMIRFIASDYATSSLEYSRGYFCRRENISEHTFYRILHAAVERQIVDDNVASKIASKSEKNSAKSAGCEGARIRSVQAYANSFEKRKNYVMSKREAKEIAEAYANSYMQQKEFKELWGLSTHLFNYALVNAIVERLVDDSTVELIRKKSETIHGETATIFIDDLVSSRRKKRKKISKIESTVEKDKKEEHRKFMKETINSFCAPDEVDDYVESMK